MKYFVRISVLIGFTAASLSAYAAADGERGKKLYAQQCSVCHSMDYNGVGPAHRGVYGRKAGSVPNYPYSSALKSSNIVWTESTLRRWLSDPQRFVPGQKMGYLVPAAKDREDLIAYLKRESDN